MDAVENAPVEGNDFACRHRADSELRELLLDLAPEVAVHRRARLDREEGSEIADGDAVKRLQAHRAGLEVVEGPPCRCLDKRIGARLQVEESIERTFDQRVREALKLEDRPFGEIENGREACRERVGQ